MATNIEDKDTGKSVAITARAQTPTGNAMQVQIGPGDVISSIPVVIDYPHHQIHEGETYTFAEYSTSLNGAKVWRISVPNLTATTATPHMLIEVISDATTTIVGLYEGAVWSGSGVNVTTQAYNHNRNIATPPSTQIYAAGSAALTASGSGTLIAQGYLFSAAKGSLGIDRSMAEWDLKANTEYLFKTTTSASGNVLTRINFYEDRGV